MLMARENTAPVTRRFAESLSFQMMGVLFASLAVPIAVAYAQLYGVTPRIEQSMVNSAIASGCAALTALFAFRRVTSFPGTRGFAYIIPSYSVTFGIAIAILLGLRLAYSGVMLSAGFVASILFGFLSTHVAQRVARRHFYLVPTGKTKIVYEATGIDWIPLRTPEIPKDDPHGAIVADLRHDHGPQWERMLAEAALAGRPVYHTKQLRESLTGKVEIEHLSENSFGSLVPSLAYHKVKRATDVLAALVALPLLSPLLVIVAVLIRLDSPGPALFRQQRMGYRGRPFEVIKFRTMADRDPGEASAREDAITRSDDVRITRIGRFLRRTRIDELPQLLNVLRGDMSMIGPRPEAVSLSEWYDEELPFYVYRHIVRPGITGWAQVNQGHVADLEGVHTKLHYDFYYIKHFSAWLDLLIAFRTIGIMFSGYGSK